MGKSIEEQNVVATNFVSLDMILGKDSTELTALQTDEVTFAKLGVVPVTGLSNDEYKVIKKDCMSFVKVGKRMQPDLDDDKLMLDVVIAAVHKDTRSDFTFRNKALIEKLGVTTAAQAAEALLSPGEIVAAAVVVQDISGFGDKAEEEAKEEVKN